MTAHAPSDTTNSALAARRDATADASLERLDAAHRRLALDPTRSFIVQAPAGAGKTELLTQRYLGLLATVDVPERIVAITFTRKAAAEMRNRVIKRLEAARGPAPASEHERASWTLAQAALRADARLGWKLLDNPERLRIATIDALCARLVRQMPYLSRFGGMPAIAEKPALHYAEAARRTVDAVESLPSVARALDYLDNDAGLLRKLLVAMLAFRDQWLVHLRDLRTGDDAALRARLARELGASLRRLVERDLVRAARAMAELHSAELMAAARYAAANAPAAAPGGVSIRPLADWTAPLATSAEALDRWRALAELLLTKTGEARKLFNKHQGLPNEKEAPDVAELKTHKATLKDTTDGLRARPAATAALRAVAQCPVPRYAANDLDAIEIFVDVLVKAYGFLWNVFQEAGETDFIEIADRALRALGDPEAPSDLALKLDYALRHLLVDEFQDTNQQQIALLEKLVAGWSPGDGRTLFVVGDPMQSIYRFRKADVGLFLGAWTRGLGDIELQPLALYRNNRSRPGVVDWINAAFAAVFPPAADPERGMVPYSPAIAGKMADPEPGGGVRAHPIVVGATPGKDAASAAEDGDALEARAILDIVDATWRADAGRDIAVLVRARAHLAPLVAEIRRRRPQLRYEAVEIESLAARQPVQDLLALTRALHHRGDRVNWLAVLRAPWCGLTLADLYQLAGAVKPDGDAPRGATWPTLWSLMENPERRARLGADGQARLAHARAALRQAVENPGRQSPRRMVESVWRRLGGPLCLDAPADAEDVAAYFKLLDKLDAAGRFDLDRLETDVADLYAAPDTDPAAGRLKFMTVHKAKGLEFDTVILPGLHRDAGRHENKLLTWEATHDEDGGKHLVVAPYRRFDASDGSDRPDDADDPSGNGAAIRAYIQSLDKHREEQENRRVLYVAATRAIRALHLLGVVKAKRDNKTGELAVAPPSGTPLDTLWPMLAGACEAALAEKSARAPDRDDATATRTTPPELADFVPRLCRLRLDALPAPVQDATASEEIPAWRAAGAPPPGDAVEPRLALDVGALTHRYLEIIAEDGVDGWDAARVRALRPVCEKWLRQQGHDRADSRAGAARVEQALVLAVGDARGRWILRKREGDAREQAHMLREQGKILGCVVDRSFVEDGVRWIIDYKTDRYAGDDPDAFVAARRAAHAPQLERYAALFRAENLPIAKALYFVALNRFEILP